MGFFGRLFSRKAHAAGVGSGQKIEIEYFGQTLLSLPELDHCGLYSRSPNGRHTLIWRDGFNGVGSSLDRGEGRYVLLDDGKRVVDAFQSEDWC